VETGPRGCLSTVASLGLALAVTLLGENVDRERHLWP
jgi:hypothetical protein